MTRLQRWLLAVSTLLLCVAASQFAIRGEHDLTGNSGYLGTELAGVEGVAPGGLSAGVRGTGIRTGVLGIGDLYGVKGEVTGNDILGIGVHGSGPTGVEGFATTPTGWGVHGVSSSGHAVNGRTTSGTAIYGSVQAGGVGNAGEFYGPVLVRGQLDVRDTTGFAVAGYTTSGTAVFGQDEGAPDGHAGFFEGAVTINGSFTHNAPAALRIDHPLDPANKFLTHASVESPEMKNMYDGVVTLDGDGTAIVELPEWFEALNRDFRYQLTCIGGHAPVYVAEEIRENEFKIAGGYAGMKVSWLITASRNDAYAQAYPLFVETPKRAHESGRYIHPELYGQPTAQRISVARSSNRSK